MGKKKKVVRLSRADAVARLDRMMPILHRNVVNALRIEATMETGNTLIQTMPDKQFPGAGAFNTVMQSLALDLAMHLARLYDVGAQRVHVNKRDVASIPLAVRLLRQKRCQDDLKARARNWLPHDRSFANQFGRGGLKTLKAFRDTFMAHSLMTDVDVRPIYNQLFRLTDCARDFVEDARLAVSGDNSSLEEHENIFADHAREFWRMALLGERDDETAD